MASHGTRLAGYSQTQNAPAPKPRIKLGQTGTLEPNTFRHHVSSLRFPRSYYNVNRLLTLLIPHLNNSNQL